MSSQAALRKLSYTERSVPLMSPPRCQMVASGNRDRSRASASIYSGVSPLVSTSQV